MAISPLALGQQVEVIRLNLQWGHLPFILSQACDTSRTEISVCPTDFHHAVSWCIAVSFYDSTLRNSNKSRLFLEGWISGFQRQKCVINSSAAMLTTKTFLFIDSMPSSSQVPGYFDYGSAYKFWQLFVVVEGYINQLATEHYLYPKGAVTLCKEMTLLKT